MAHIAPSKLIARLVEGCARTSRASCASCASAPGADAIAAAQHVGGGLIEGPAAEVAA